MDEGQWGVGQSWRAVGVFSRIFFSCAEILTFAFIINCRIPEKRSLLSFLQSSLPPGLPSRPPPPPPAVRCARDSQPGDHREGTKCKGCMVWILWSGPLAYFPTHPNEQKVSGELRFKKQRTRSQIFNPNRSLMVYFKPDRNPYGISSHIKYTNTLLSSSETVDI